MNTRICMYCGAEFVGAVTARYCSPRCEKAAQRQRQARRVTHKGGDTNGYKATCARCGQGFNPKHPARRYCSKACRQAAYRERKERKGVR